MPKKPKAGKPKTSRGNPLPNAPQRLATALALLADGKRYMAVRAALMTTFSISHSTAEGDIKAAYKVIADEAEAEAPQFKARISDRLWRVALKAERIGEYAAAVSALGRLAKIHGFESPTKLEVSGGLTEEQRQLLSAINMTPHDRQQRIAELEAKRADASTS